jgi:hypothetical protein
MKRIALAALLAVSSFTAPARAQEPMKSMVREGASDLIVYIMAGYHCGLSTVPEASQLMAAYDVMDRTAAGEGRARGQYLIKGLQAENSRAM